MNWFSQNKFLAGFLVILVLAIGGAGFYLSQGYSKYRNAMDTFDQERDSLASLQGKPLFPSEENVDFIRDEVENYQARVLELQQALLNFQKPLNNEIADTQFPNLLKDRIEKFQSLAASEGVKLPADFYMGLPDYRSNFPRPEAVGLLHFQVVAIDTMLKKLVVAGVEEVVALQRERLAIENDGYEAPDPAPVLEKYPVALTISGSHETVREFFNTLSNDKEYFYNIRFVRIENSAKEGPRRGSGGSDGLDPSSPLDSGFPQPDATFQGLGFPDDPDAPAGPAQPVYDARIVMGQEKIQVFMVIDVVRFVEVK